VPVRWWSANGRRVPHELPGVNSCIRFMPTPLDGKSSSRSTSMETPDGTRPSGQQSLIDCHACNAVLYPGLQYVAVCADI